MIYLFILSLLQVVNSDLVNKTVYFNTDVWPIIYAYAQPHLLMFTDVLWISDMTNGYEQLLESSVEVPRMCRITPCDPDSSYLLHKVKGTHLSVGGVGVRMPLSMPPLNAKAIDTIETWIVQGARFSAEKPRGRNCSFPSPQPSLPPRESAFDDDDGGGDETDIVPPTRIAVIFCVCIVVALVIRQVWMWYRRDVVAGQTTVGDAYAPVSTKDNSVGLTDAGTSSGTASQTPAEIAEVSVITQAVSRALQSNEDEYNPLPEGAVG